jgi:hypothetical protein
MQGRRLSSHNIRLEIFMAVKIQVVVFWVTILVVLSIKYIHSKHVSPKYECFKIL